MIWPEAAAPFLLERDPRHRAAIAAVAPEGGYVITGAMRANPPPEPATQIWNSIEAIDGAGAIRAVYDKAHLVPFGEYMPFRGLLPIDDFIPGAIDMTPGPGPRTLALPGLPAFAATVCYEAIFPGRVVDAAARPGLDAQRHERRLVRKQLRPVPAFRDRPHPRGRGGAAAGARRQ